MFVVESNYLGGPEPVIRVDADGGRAWDMP